VLKTIQVKKITEQTIQKRFQKQRREICQVTIYRMSQEECARLWEGVPYVKVCRYDLKYLCPKFYGYGDNGQRSVKL
jgi:hypothetical protein